MRPSNQQQPIWAWVVLIGGALFLISALPGMLFIIFMPFWKADELSFFTMIFAAISLCILIVTAWGIKRAYNALRDYNRAKKAYELESLQEKKLLNNLSSETKKPIWPWIVIGLGALLVVSSGPGIIMLPIGPLFLAGMSTDSGTTPDYVPFLIIVIGYGLMAGYVILLIKAIKTLRAKK
ncbi:hypothetical protein [Neobacillus sp. 114]|uniref:hypothetical protein n=1 Tax=Neobacillus sp. 114 TaxID=3048535 RepID=UPI0024C2909B|nr:hypothetical protein [Neobacillus sp. 114]